MALAAVGRIKLLTRDVFETMPLVNCDSRADDPLLRNGDALTLLLLVNDELLWLELDTAFRNAGRDTDVDK